MQKSIANDQERYRQLEANIMLESQKNEIQYTLSQLKSTQAQLIQFEKLASLGGSSLKASLMKFKTRKLRQ